MEVADVGFAEEVAAVMPDRDACKTCSILKQQKDVKDLVAYIAANPKQAKGISLALTKRGFPVGETAVRQHIQGKHDVLG